MYLTDYQGNVTHTVNGSAEIEQTVFYYPDGEPWVEPTGKNPYLFGGKERITFAGLRQYDFGARMLNSTVGSWWQVDPKCEDYYPMNPYSPMGANPVMYTDPTGTKIIGATKSDAQAFRDDIYQILNDDKFEALRSLISVRGTKFKQISQRDLSAALNGVECSADETAYISMVVNAINSKEKHYVEYLTETDNITKKGCDALGNYFSKQVVDKKYTLDTMLRREAIGSDGTSYYYYEADTILKLGGNGFNVPYRKGLYSFVNLLSGGDRAINSTHEVFGHGIPSSMGVNSTDNNRNAIRADNLARRLLGRESRGWICHGDNTDLGNPNLLPIIK